MDEKQQAQTVNFIFQAKTEQSDLVNQFIYSSSSASLPSRSKM